MNRIALNLGFVQIYWYSIFVFLGIFVGSTIILREAKKQKINQDFIVNLIFYAILFGLIGARLYYVGFNLSYYSRYPLEILEVWDGGLAIHGGILFGLFTVIFYTKKYRAKTMKILDILVLGLIIGQAIGRWGNFFNSEVYGSITTLEHLQKLSIPDFIINGMYIKGAYRTPLFLYESIWSIIGFIVLLIVRRYKYLKNGQLTGVYLIWYSLGRMILEGMRDPEFILKIGSVKVAQVACMECIIAGILMIIFCKKGTRFDNLYKEESKEQIRF